MSSNAIDPISAIAPKQGIIAIETAASTGKTAGNSQGATSTTVAKSVVTQPDTSQLSPLAKVVAALQKLEKADPAKYEQLTQQIAANLQTAAQAAQKQGNTNEAKQLSALAGDLTGGSKSGQVSKLIQDLTSATASNNSKTASTSAPNTVSNTSSSQLLSLLQKSESQSTQSATVDAAAIILNTLNASGIS